MQVVRSYTRQVSKRGKERDGGGKLILRAQLRSNVLLLFIVHRLELVTRLQAKCKGVWKKN